MSPINIEFFKSKLRFSQLNQSAIFFITYLLSMIFLRRFSHAGLEPIEIFLVLGIIFYFKSILQFLKSINLIKSISILFILYYIFGIVRVTDFVWYKNYVKEFIIGISFIFFTFYNQKDDETFKLLLKVLAFVFLSLISIGFLESLNLFHFPNSPFVLENLYGMNMFERSYFINVPTVSFAYMNNFAFYLVLLFPFTVYQFKKNKTLLFITFALATWNILFIASRVAVVSYAITLVFLIFLKNIHAKKLSLAFLTIFIVTLVQPSIFFKNNDARLSRLQSILPVAQKLKQFFIFNTTNPTHTENQITSPPPSTAYVGSYDERSEIFKLSLQKFWTHKWFGTGPGNSLVTPSSREKPINVHNFLIEILIENGVLGAFILLSAIGLSVVKLYQNQNLSRDFKYIIYFGLFLIAFGGISPSSLINNAGLWFYIGIFSQAINYKNQKINF